jgi:predicted permease
MFRKQRRESDFAEEIRSHLELEAGELESEGMSRQEAVRTARVSFGNVATVQERFNLRNRWLWPEFLLQDLRYAVLSLARSPGFAITAVLTLALGIGATTAIFTLVHAVLLKSLPVKDPGQLWRVGDNEQCCIDEGLPDLNDWSLFSYEQYREFRDGTPGFESLAAFSASDRELAVRRAGTRDSADSYYAEWVSGNAFDTLGIRPYTGRLLRPSDDRQAAAPVAVMSFQAWEQRFGKDPSVIGATFVMNGQPVTIVGIAPPGFYGERLTPDPPSFWLSLNLVPLLAPSLHLLDRGDTQWLNLFGRIRPDTNIAATQALMQVQLRQFLESPLSGITGADRTLIPKQYLRISPGGSGVRRMQDAYKSELQILFWISAFVLLIACGNLANLILARSVTQRQQVSVRTALGAPRTRLVQRALVECLLISVLGGATGLMVAYGGARLILHLAFRHNPDSIQADPSLLVLGFAFGVSLLTGLLFGVAPAWMAAHADPIEARRGANRSTGRYSLWGQKALVIIQVTVSAVLLCVAGFLVLSLERMHDQRFGFETAHRYILKIDPQTIGYKPEQLEVFYRQLHDSLVEIPGISNIAYSIYSPMSGNNWSQPITIEGQPADTPGQWTGASWNRISPGYFEAIGTKLIAGRNFTESDDASSHNVAIVNQAFVKKLLNGKDPVGMHFGDWVPGPSQTYEIVGVVEDTQYWDPDEEIRPMYFLPASQWTQLPSSVSRASDYAEFIARSHYLQTIEIETRGAVPNLELQVRKALSSVNADLLVIRFQSFATQVALAFSQQALIAQLTSLFGLLALTLAAIGLYGVMTYSVVQRTNEIGIRMALGATRLRVQKLILSEALLQIGIGLMIGIPLAVVAGHLMLSHLFGITANNPIVLGITAAVLVSAAVIAAALPARRAAAIEPITALHSQ